MLGGVTKDRAPAVHDESWFGGSERGNRESLGELLERHRNHLHAIATAQLDRRVRHRIDPSDVVQEAMLAACRDFARFRGRSDQELIAWLRKVLLNCLGHVIEVHLKAEKRDVRREVTLNAITDSVSPLEQTVIDPAESPVTLAKRRERAAALSRQLANLRPQYRQVIVLRSLRELSFDEVSERMDRSVGAVRMLWLRAIGKLRHDCDPID